MNIPFHDNYFNEGGLESIRECFALTEEVATEDAGRVGAGTRTGRREENGGPENGGGRRGERGRGRTSNREGEEGKERWTRPKEMERQITTDYRKERRERERGRTRTGGERVKRGRRKTERDEGHRGLADVQSPVRPSHSG